MTSEWRATTLGAICEVQGGAIQTGPFGSQLHTSDYKEHGIPVVMPTNIIDGGIEQNGIARINSFDVERLSQHKLKIGDIVFSRRGDVTKNALIRPDEVGWLCGTGCLKVRLGNEKIAIAKYISHCLRLPETKEWLVRHAVGATMPNLNTAILSAVPIFLPPLKSQIDIAAILDSFDDRINLLRKTNTTLEAIAQALFKSWFIDFDPVRAKAEGGEPEGMDATIAALFSNSFEESEFGVFPSGWEVLKVEDLMELPYGKALKATDRVDGPVPVYGSGGITGSHNKPLVNGPSVIVGRKGTVGSLYWEDRPFYPIDTVFYVRTKIPLTYCYYLLKTLGLEGMNTDGAVPGLNRNNVYRLPVIVATTPILESFDEIVSSLREKIFLNRQLAQNLTTLRDTLLPRLISGQLRLPEPQVTVANMLSEVL
ncbi:restriction endonuclease subunit S [Pseudomonas marginalis]|uniref:restriction endonuclease subunit S n=1 Tax=Pseudomonas marginalis TaxID=298 RepID=UPI003BA069D8